ncbi:MAG: hypothetical protein ACI4VX_00255 [Succinivibrionaceae bacterium]
MGGITYNLQCPVCGKKYEISYGSSMLCTNRALTIASFHNGGKPLLEYFIRSRKILKKTFDLLHKGYSLESGYGHSLYYCSHCRKIFNRFSFKLSKDNEIWEPPYVCWHCGRKITPVPQENFKNIKVTCICKNDIFLDAEGDQIPELWS